MIARGGELFESARCVWCHGDAPGLIPTFLELTPEKHAIFNEIVLGGVLEARGMASFADVLSESDVEAIHAYIVDLTRQELRNQSGD
jgi:quinohemoprotein ethanol dehydrogenase